MLSRILCIASAHGTEPRQGKRDIKTESILGLLLKAVTCSSQLIDWYLLKQVISNTYNHIFYNLLVNLPPNENLDKTVEQLVIPRIRRPQFLKFFCFRFVVEVWGHIPNS